MRTIDEARKLLEAADVFFGRNIEDDEKWAQMLNMNDVWCWACADCEYVSDEKLPEVAELFFNYGWAGILYWVSEQHNNMRSEFENNNRFIEFVRQEEKLCKKVPDNNKRAYEKFSYTLGDKV
jgi:nitroimidazol reductase NimA-like FMN-containing flavoprotein (pyridoxamine 5'-phosphate oxidase superfamily)